MANPYTEVSISNYNANPPPDDGSTGTDNQLTWAKHKDKLADPIKNAYESSQTNITSAFAKLPFSAVVSVTGNHTQVAGDRGKLYNCTNSPTIDLLAAATAGSSFTFGVYNAGSGTVTLDGNSSETVQGAATFALAPGESGIFVTDGSNWQGVSASLADFGVTSTVTELNILDGVTATAAELNELDESVAAVTSYESGVRTYFFDDTPNTTAFDPDAVIGASFESVGPTGSGATNIWTALDDVPSGAKAVILKTRNQVNGGTTATNYGNQLIARVTGSATAANDSMTISENRFTNHSGLGENYRNISEHVVPIDASGRFDLYFVASGGTDTLNMYLVGFIA